MLEVANYAKVSPMRVFRVLRDDPRVLPETREFIIEAVATVD